MYATVSAQQLKAWLADGQELALLDVREAGQFGESHLFFAVPLPYSRFELELPRLVPRKDVRLVLCDDGSSGVAGRAAKRAASLGFSRVHVLEQGTAGWSAAGFQLYSGVNVPSKAFGELVEHARHVPRISARDLQAMRERGEPMVIVDGRPLAEYGKMNIPGGVCCPNGELALRIGRIAPDARTKIVVNCAGRTRSIIGAQTLIDFGVPNPVVALENGTQGWFLAGLELERGAARRYPEAPSGSELEALRARAEALAHRSQVPSISSSTLEKFLADRDRTTYVLDVRTAEEFAAASIAGAQHAPGGQLVQATDQWVGVRGARLVLVDGEGVRAIVVANWLRQMGHDAYVLKDGIRAKVSVPAMPPPALPDLLDADPTSLEGARILDLRSSAAYRKGHVRGAAWAIRPRLPEAADGRVVLVAEERGVAQLAAIDLQEKGARDVRFLDAARAASLPQEATPGRPADGERIDFLFFTAKRHEGDRAAAEQYLAWETALVGQLDAAERGSFRL
ncbi:MAG: rhodanese-like domain-containing protein [Clostridia bacterium]